jgi:hypothetical protein
MGGSGKANDVQGRTITQPYYLGKATEKQSEAQPRSKFPDSRKKPIELRQLSDISRAAIPPSSFQSGELL